jgi:hypothetical protein
MVVRDILRPEHDPVRADGTDDPSGGVLDGAPDRFVLPLRFGAGAGHEPYDEAAEYEGGDGGEVPADAARGAYGTGGAYGS